MSAFSALIGSLMSPDNATRTAGESMLNELKAQPDTLATCLINALRHSEAVEHRSLCAVLIRRVRSELRRFFQIANARVAAFASASSAEPSRRFMSIFIFPAKNLPASPPCYGSTRPRPRSCLFSWLSVSLIDARFAGADEGRRALAQAEPAAEA